MKLFSLEWKSSSKPSKQRKYRAHAPLHMRRRFLIAPLAPDLRARYNKRNLSIREGDTVRIAGGEFRGITGKVNRVNLREGIVYVDGVERIRKEGTKSFFPVRPGNIVLTEVNLEDKRRMAILARKSRK